MDYWIIVTNDAKEEPGVKARDVLARRLEDGFYGISASARYRNWLSKDDIVVFYLAGRKEKLFVAEAKLAEQARPLTPMEQKQLCHGPAFGARGGIFLTDPKWWDNPIPLHQGLEVMPSLRRYSDNPGNAVRNTINKIQKDDYDALIALQ